MAFWDNWSLNVIHHNVSKRVIFIFHYDSFFTFSYLQWAISTCSSRWNQIDDVDHRYKILNWSESTIDLRAETMINPSLLLLYSCNKHFSFNDFLINSFIFLSFFSLRNISYSFVFKEVNLSFNFSCLLSWGLISLFSSNSFSRSSLILLMARVMSVIAWVSNRWRFVLRMREALGCDMSSFEWAESSTDMDDSRIICSWRFEVFYHESGKVFTDFSSLSVISIALDEWKTDWCSISTEMNELKSIFFLLWYLQDFSLTNES